MALAVISGHQSFNKSDVTKPQNRSLDYDGRFRGIPKNDWPSCVVHNLFDLRIRYFLQNTIVSVHTPLYRALN